MVRPVKVPYLTFNYAIWVVAVTGAVNFMRLGGSGFNWLCSGNFS